MSESTESRTSTPVHLWIVGVIALLWNAMGAYDYLMTQTHNEAYLSSFTPEHLEFFNSFPMWVIASWAIAVWGSVLASLLLLLRSRHAVVVFLVSFLAMVLTTFHNFVLSHGLEIMGDPVSLFFSILIFFVALALYLYSKAMRNKRVLA
jgi:hypothetical protein